MADKVFSLGILSNTEFVQVSCDISIILSLYIYYIDNGLVQLYLEINYVSLQVQYFCFVSLFRVRPPVPPKPKVRARRPISPKPPSGVSKPKVPPKVPPKPQWRPPNQGHGPGMGSPGRPDPLGERSSSFDEVRPLEKQFW